ncbi:MAG TPA: DNA repair protein RecO [Gammaproteobacteria bacterium]|jgi:DNA repair protein RecO (recombination protein O)|nr:DNA repair protein RecO [Gammaproteobacteria bacterium]
MRVENQPAFILHHYPYRDTSQILDLLTRDFGRLSVVSRGSLAARSKLKSILQPFRLLNVSWVGKGDMPTLINAELAELKPVLLDGRRLTSGFYLNELMMHFLQRHDFQEDLFQLYANTVSWLATDTSLEIVLRIFEKRLLDALGVGLNLTHDADSGEAIKPDNQYIYFIEHGPVLALSGDMSSQQRPLLNGESLLAFSRDELGSEAIRREIKSLMRHVIAFYLAGKPLRSRELFR